MPFRMDRRPLRSASWKANSRRWSWARSWQDGRGGWANPIHQQKACRQSRLIMGMPGGRIALAIRGGRRP
ncbi:hypothetical protein COO09_23360 [Rhizorhabdus dicambivorans]|uniref:Uncharacterized protein n=1 Tax=Rhizorhabdus dicambivorans TaxID=1850238 RepID=A0A2A4FQW2_9SPHN|nr:hypothetical protein CMV14_26150 [Rhizorhabdus dicambivorans]ATE68034.1 hypothetical protein CMV14_26300 [Rhizorhabdus dicambivorans]PCE39838.1 hypothetical protein COO09_23360 [Rhizorhabdus dicambivorans]